MDPILVELEDDVDLYDEYYDEANACVDYMTASTKEFEGYMSLVIGGYNTYDAVGMDIVLDTDVDWQSITLSYDYQNLILLYYLYYTFDFLVLLY